MFAVPGTFGPTNVGEASNIYMKWDAPLNSTTLKETSKISNYQMKSNLLSDFFGQSIAIFIGHHHI